MVMKKRLFWLYGQEWRLDMRTVEKELEKIYSQIQMFFYRRQKKITFRHCYQMCERCHKLKVL